MLPLRFKKITFIAPLFFVVVLFTSIYSSSTLHAQFQKVEANASLSKSGITFSTAGGVYKDDFSLILTSENGHAIRYTLDGSEPSIQNGITYSTPISISGTQIVKAKSFDATANASPVVTRVYIQLADDLTQFTSDLPIMIINAFNTEITDAERVPAYLEINGEVSLEQTDIMSDASALKSSILINKRGASSLSFPKNGYGFHLKEDNLIDDRAEALLGMPEEHNWVLHGPYTDMTLMRNAISYQLARSLGWYAPRTRYVELFLHNGNGPLTKDNYHGLYVLTERIKWDNNRVNIQRLRPDDLNEPEISGGYIIKVDRLGEGELGFTSRRNTPFVFVRPDETDIMLQQKNWITNYMNEMEQALYRPDFMNPNVGYAKYINVDSFIDHFLLTELLKEIDGYRLSTFMYKDRDSKLVMGPLWDFNLAIGLADYVNGWNPQGWYYNDPGFGCYITCAVRDWYVRLLQDDNFKERLERRWWTLREGAFSDERLIRLIDEHRQQLTESQERNFARWPVLGTYVWPNYYSFINSWDGHVTNMSNWLTERVAWIDTQMGDKRFEENPDNEERLIYFWLFDDNLENDMPFEELPSTFSQLSSQAILRFESSLTGYPFNDQHPDWRTASMERRNRPTAINYRSEANSNRAYSDANMRGIQIRQPFQDTNRENILVFEVPIKDLSDPVFSFAAMDEDAAEKLIIEYQIDQSGVNWTQVGLKNPVLKLSNDYQLFTVDFFDIDDVDNNEFFKIRIRFAGSNMTASDGERVTFNNFSLDAKRNALTSIDQNVDELASKWELSQNYPNPFNPQTTIRYTLAKASDVRLEVYTIQGKKVAILQDGRQSAGTYSNLFNASNLSSGMYFYRLTTPSFQQTKSMVLIK